MISSTSARLLGAATTAVVVAVWQRQERGTLSWCADLAAASTRGVVPQPRARSPLSAAPSAESATTVVAAPARNADLPFFAKVDAHHAQIARSKAQSRLIFLGTGSSSSTPIAHCLTEDSAGREACRLAHAALQVPPHECKNHRLNVSVLIHHVAGPGRDSLVQIDAGKTFREAVVRWCVTASLCGCAAAPLLGSGAGAVV
jgi:hypothetical protein